MYGTITTKLGGLRHVYEYTFNFHQLSLEEALPGAVPSAIGVSSG